MARQLTRVATKEHVFFIDFFAVCSVLGSRRMLTRETMLRKLHLRDEFYRRRARQSFAEFIRYTRSDYQLSWFHEELAGELDQFLDDVLAKRSPR